MHGSAPGCPADVGAFVVYLTDPGQGSHAVPPLVIEGTCRRHRKRVEEHARRSSFGWLQPGLVPAGQVLDMLEWFYGDSGLSAGPRGLSVGTSHL